MTDQTEPKYQEALLVIDKTASGTISSGINGGTMKLLLLLIVIVLLSTAKAVAIILRNKNNKNNKTNNRNKRN